MYKELSEKEDYRATLMRCSYLVELLLEVLSPDNDEGNYHLLKISNKSNATHIMDILSIGFNDIDSTIKKYDKR